LWKKQHAYFYKVIVKFWKGKHETQLVPVLHRLVVCAEISNPNARRTPTNKPFECDFFGSALSKQGAPEETSIGNTPYSRVFRLPNQRFPGALRRGLSLHLEPPLCFLSQLSRYFLRPSSTALLVEVNMNTNSLCYGFAQNKFKKSGGISSDGADKNIILTDKKKHSSF